MQPQKPGILEQIFTVITLVLYTNGPFNVILSGGASQGDMLTSQTDYTLTRNIYMLIYLISAVLVAVRWRRALYLLTKGKFIILLFLVALASNFWSTVPAVTHSRSIALVGTLLFALYFASRYTIRQQLRILGITCGVILGMSLLFIVALPKYGIMGGVHSGAWRGIYTHKNVFGKVLVVCTMVFLVLANTMRRKRWMPWLGLLLSVALLIPVRSTSALFNAFILIISAYAFKTIRWRYDLRALVHVTLILVGATLYIFLLTHAESVLGTFGKDLTLTGRTELWPPVIEKIQEHFWWGYGFNAFWEGGLDGDVAYVWRVVQWRAPHAHNGFLDHMLNVGFVGLLLFALDFVIVSFRSLDCVSRARSHAGIWPALFMTFFILANLTESTLMGRNSLYWVIYVSLSLCLRLPFERQFAEEDGYDEQFSEQSSTPLIASAGLE